MTVKAAAFGYLQQMVKEQAGIVVETDKEYLAESKLSGLAREQGFSTLEPLVDQLRRAPYGELHRRVVEALTTNETSFFRDQLPFETLRTTLIPQLLAKSSRPLTIWCAACSSGQEPYSVAILIKEHFSRIASQTRIIASDVSREMLARTKLGVYTQFEVNRGLSGVLRSRYMMPVNAGWQTKPELRAMVETREINLATAFPPLPQIDILLVRNVLIYFDTPTKQDILTRMHRALGPDGLLFLGGGESTLGFDVGFERCTSENKATWYRRKETK